MGVGPVTISLFLLLWVQYLFCQEKGTFKSQVYGNLDGQIFYSNYATDL